MKKPILFACLLAASGSIFAQSAQYGQRLATKHFKQKVQAVDVKSGNNSIVSTNASSLMSTVPSNSNSRAAALNKVKIGTSYNQYSVLLEEQSCLTANQDLGLIGFIHRQCSTYPKGTLPNGNPATNGSGRVQLSYSLDEGATWDTSLVITSDGNRYPSGGIYNPVGNTDVSNTFAVVGGPSLNNIQGGDAAEWASNYAASAQLDGSNIDENYINSLMAGQSSGTPTHFTMRNYMSVRENGKAYIGGVDFNSDGTTYDFLGYKVLEGTFNTGTNAYDWATTNYDHTFSTDPADGTDNHSTSGMAWSQDGNIGYVVHIGRDATTDVRSPQPIVYKTTDAGATWNLMPIQDLSSIQVFQDSLPNMAGQLTARPYFSTTQGIDFTVDKFGNLHIFSVILGSSSNHNDSLNYIWTDADRIFDVYTTSNGGWGASPVGVISTDVVADDASCAVNGIGYNARLQASRTQDGSKVFCQWTDTDFGNFTENCFPDISSWGLDVTTGLMTGPKNFTSGTAYQIQNRWMFVSDITLVNGNGDYMIPTTTSVASSNSDLDPMVHYFVQGIEFTDADFAIDAGMPVSVLVEEYNDITCNGASDGAITVGLSSTATPFTYSWSNSSTTSSVANLSAGTISVTVTDNDGKSDNMSFTISEPSVITMTVNSDVILCEATEAEIGATVAGGWTPYSYAWSNSAVTASQTGLAAGVYTVTMTDNGGCVMTMNSTITDNIFTVNATATNTTNCGASDGMVSLTVTGGVTPYSYNWNNGSTDASLTGLSAGNYSVTVADNNSCSKTKMALINDASNITVTNTVSNQTLCNGSSDGQLEITVSGDATAVTYVWNDGNANDVSSLFSSASITVSTSTALSAGDYIVTVSTVQSTGLTCLNFDMYSIDEPSVITASTTVTSNPSCTGLSDGSAVLAAMGGNSGFSYMWESGATTANASGLADGYASFTITDVNNCTAVDSVMITDPAPVSITVTGTNPLCYAGTDGSVMVEAEGGTGVVAGYSYNWSNDSTEASVAGIGAGVYMVTTTDNNNCTATGSVTLTEPAEIVITVVSVTENTTNWIGAIDIDVTGGTGALTYAWSGPSNYTSTSQDASNITTQGTYTVVVTDANSCTATTSQAVAGNVSIEELTANSFNVYPNPNDGQFTLSINGNSNAVYQIELRNVVGQVVSTTQSIGNNVIDFNLNNFDNGVYFLTVTNGSETQTQKVIIK